jgi:hypothetical protein
MSGKIAMNVFGVVWGCCAMAVGDQHVSGPSPTWYIRHVVMGEDETPNRTEIGIGEQVSLWVGNRRDSDYGTGPKWRQTNVNDDIGDVQWIAFGAGSVDPEMGPLTTLTADYSEQGTSATVQAQVSDAGIHGSGSRDGWSTQTLRSDVLAPSGVRIVSLSGDEPPETRQPANNRMAAPLKIASGGTDDDLSTALSALDRLRQGRKTPFDEAEKRAGELLKKYPSPKDQGQIYYELVQIYGQGAGPPERIISYAKKALQLPLDPRQKIRLYTYWGDAILMLTPTDPLPERRKAATVVFLEGLVQLRKFSLPEKPPAIPTVELHDEFHDESSDNEASVRQAEERNQRDMAAVERARFVRAMIHHRDVLTGQIVWLYARKPIATNELRELATKTTKDPVLVDRLGNAVEAKIKATK